MRSKLLIVFGLLLAAASCGAQSPVFQPSNGGASTSTTSPQAFSGPISAPQIGTIFYADGYASPDAAFTAASAWVTANNKNALLQFGTGTYRHCNAFTLPALASGATLSLNGVGAINTTVQQSCSVAVASVGQPFGANPNQQPDIANMTIDANGNAPAALEVFGVRRSKIEHLLLKNANGSDHVLQLGSTGSGYSYELQVNDILIQTSPSVSGVVDPLVAVTMTTGAISGTTITSAGSNLPAGTSVLVLDPLQSCTTLPVGTAVLSGGTLTGITWSQTGVACGQVYVQVFPTASLNYGLLIQNVTDSDFYAVRTNGNFTVAGTYITGGSGDNRYYGLHPIGSIVGVYDGGHSAFIGFECDSTFKYCIDFEGTNSSVSGLSRTWNNSYPGSSDFFFGSLASKIKMSNLWCGANQTAGGYNEFVTATGNVFVGGLPGGVSMLGNQVCDGTGLSKDFDNAALVLGGNLSVSFDNSTIGAFTIGAGGATTNFFSVSGSRARFGYETSKGDAFIQGGGHGVTVDVNNTGNAVGGTTSGWTSAGTPYDVVGATLNIAAVANSTIAPTAAVVHVTATTGGSIQTMTVPTGCAVTTIDSLNKLCKITLWPDFAWTIVTGGNFANASTAVVNKPMDCRYDPTLTKWGCSY
jgi:hypothetical protein